MEKAKTMTSLYPTTATQVAHTHAKSPCCWAQADDPFVYAEAVSERRQYRAQQAKAWQPAPLPVQPYQCRGCGTRFDTSARQPAKYTSCPSCAALSASVALHSAPVVWVGPGDEPV